MEQVFVHSMIIDKPGGLFHFELRLPQDAKRIVGIETGLSIRNNIPGIDRPVLAERFRLERNILVGRLKLELLNTAGFFYSKDIFESDFNELKAEIAHMPVLVNPKGQIWGFVPPVQNGFDAYRWVHAGKREEEQMNIENSTVLRGFYKDIFCDEYALLANYTIKVYTWIETT